MTKFRYSIPSEFSDEDRWFKYFTKRDLIALAIGGVITVALYRFTLQFGKPIIGLIIGGIIIAISLSLSMNKIPDTFYLKGGGQPIVVYLLKILIRKKKKVIYVKGYSE